MCICCAGAVFSRQPGTGASIKKINVRKAIVFALPAKAIPPRKNPFLPLNFYLKFKPFMP
ncbi:hypothetical protein PTH_0809 [Pelotomaculum thermopropionicum SI]|uniref:Uncharacterized protein n=1 Tax=Pelotomaculum thermopropionicum (strain DSM 13744 / JCM 10971 / SI) TaxID=370438 RepID=A5D453_PELTS|nr:hypothetical protein PTH_0809 [Pelotomaculum thermopropionicum SI]